MNLNMTTNWSYIDHRTYLIVTITSDRETEAAASQMYLDIQLPEGVLIRHIGNLPGDGHANTIGVDLPDLAASDHHNVVFRVKTRQAAGAEITPELHLHWIDSITGDLLERHQTGTRIPVDSGEANTNLVEIVAAARSEHKTSRRRSRRSAFMKETDSMTIQRHPRTKRHSHCNHRGHGVGYRAGGRARAAMSQLEGEGRGHRHSGRGHLHMAIERMQQRIDHMERRMRRMQRMAQMSAEGSGEQVTRRPRRRCEHDARTSRSNAGHRMYDEGRRMGRMARHSFATTGSRYAREGRGGECHSEG